MSGRWRFMRVACPQHGAPLRLHQDGIVGSMLCSVVPQAGPSASCAQMSQVVASESQVEVAWDRKGFVVVRPVQ